MRLVESSLGAAWRSYDPLEEITTFAHAIGAGAIARQLQAARDQRWTSQLFVMVLGSTQERLALVECLLGSALPKKAPLLEALPLLVRYGRSPHARVHFDTRIREVPVEHLERLVSTTGLERVVEIVVPGELLDHGICICSVADPSDPAISKLVPYADLAMIVSGDVASVERDLQIARSVGIDLRDVVTVAFEPVTDSLHEWLARAPVLPHMTLRLPRGPTARRAAHPEWTSFCTLLRRCAAGAGAPIVHEVHDLHVRRAIELLRRVLIERRRALESPATIYDAHVADHHRGAQVARTRVEGRDAREPRDDSALQERLEIERTKLLMGVKADLLARLGAQIARLDGPRALVVPRAIAVAHDLAETAVFAWSEELRRVVEPMLVALLEAHLHRSWAGLDGFPEVAIAAAALVDDSRAFVRVPRPARRSSPRAPRRRVDDWLRTHAGMRRRAATVAAESLLATLETSSRHLVQQYLDGLHEAPRAIDAAVVWALEKLADVCSDASVHAAHRRAIVGTDGAIHEVSLQRARLEELVQQLASGP
jgi:hypothetical protein